MGTRTRIDIRIDTSKRREAWESNICGRRGTDGNIENSMCLGVSLTHTHHHNMKTYL